MADGLVKVQVALGNIASKRERVKVLYKTSKCFHEVPACPPQAYASWFPAQALKPNRSLEFPFGDSRWRRFPDEMVNWGMLSTLWLNPKPMAMS